MSVKSVEFKSNSERIIYYILSATILIDFVNGILSDYPIGELTRIAFIIIFFVILLKEYVNEVSYIYIMLLYLLINSAVSFFSNQNIFGFYFDLKMTSKAIYFVLIYKTIKSLYINNKFNFLTIEKIIMNNLYYTPVLFLISYVFKIGKHSYSNMSIGFKGTFLSLNSINVAMIVLLIFSINNLIHSKNKLKWIAITLYILIPLILLGTKSSIIFIIFTIFMFFILNVKSVKTIIAVIAFIIILITSWFLLQDSFFINYVKLLIYRQVYLFQNRDLVTYLLSGRNWLLDVGWENFSSGINIFRILFGDGYFASHNNIALSLYMSTNSVRPVELDFMDILFAYGASGILLTYGYFFRIFFESIKSLFTKDGQPYLISLISLLIFSLFGGHVFLEAISSTFLGICLAGGYINSLKYKNIKVNYETIVSKAG